MLPVRKLGVLDFLFDGRGWIQGFEKLPATHEIEWRRFAREDG